MSEPSQEYETFSIDFRTGLPTAITGKETGESQRAACAALNRRRARGIRKAAQEDAPGQSVSAHVWQSAFERKVAEWDVPLIPLEKLGIRVDCDGFPESDSFLTKLTSGAEAHPYLDHENGVVYKLFDLKVSGALGKKLNLEREEEGEFQIELRDADLNHTLDKLSVLNLIGGHPTEIVGLAESGDYLIAKQPLAFEFKNFQNDLKIAVARLKGIFPRQCHFRKEVVVVWCEGDPWFVGDLHDRNIMRDSNSRPCVIDALVGEITPMAIQLIPWLRNAIVDAKLYSETGKKPTYDLFDEIDDSEL
ncbi:hypothetical protein AAFN60_06555 [Roseibacillus persicicus]|uniref:hypothetical protein n=1 Tax=Roseibacillus persicicus TaxID=454148 RepID=UPI00398A602D